MTIAQIIFARVKEEFARGSTRISKSEVIAWDIEYEEGGQKKHANGDTKARTLRRLIEENYLGRVEEGGQAYIVPATGEIRSSGEAKDEEEKPVVKYRYEQVYDEFGKPTGVVKPVPITD